MAAQEARMDAKMAAQEARMDNKMLILTGVVVAGFLLNYAKSSQMELKMEKQRKVDSNRSNATTLFTAFTLLSSIFMYMNP